MSEQLATQDLQNGSKQTYAQLLKWSILAWTVVGIVGFAQDIIRGFYWGWPHPFEEGPYWLFVCPISAVFTPFIIRGAQRWPLELRYLRKHVSLHFAFSIAFGIARDAVLAVLVLPFLARGLFYPRPDWATSATRVFVVISLMSFMTGIIAYWIIVSIQAIKLYYDKFQERAQQAIRLELHASELRAQLAQAQLGALKMQLQPHFLFNTLNTMMGMIRTGEVKQAEHALARFGDLLRTVLDDMDAQEVTLERELTYLRLYLSIEQMRFSDRLVVRIDPDPDVLDAAVPHMALQPVAENAVRHGIGCRVGNGSIEVRASRVGSRLHITLQNSGGGVRVGSWAGRGLGLSNLRARLEQLYGAEGELRVRCTDDGAVVEVVVPYRQHSAATEVTASLQGVPA